MKIIITGASGFIGTNLLQYFIEKKYEVLNIDKAVPQNKEHLSHWVNIDIIEYDKLENAVLPFSPEYIIHLAARTDLDGKDMEDYSANTIGVANILQVAGLCPNLKKIIIASSMLVCHAGYYPKNQFDYTPKTLYGESKVITEKEVWKNPPACDWAIIRPTSIWGEWFRIPYRSFFDMVIAGRYFHIGHHSCTKTYGYIGNAIYQIESILFADTLDINNKIFYIGDSPAINIEDWANEIAGEIHTRIIRIPFFLILLAAFSGDILNFVGIKFPIYSFRLKNMTTDNIIDLEKTYQIAPFLPFKRIEGVQRTIKWIGNSTYR